jgi:hypothetical protein
VPPLNEDAATAFLRAVRHALGSFSGFDLEEIVTRSWASGTFTGARHELAFQLVGEGAEMVADAFVAVLDRAEVAMRGHLLADIALLSQERRDGVVKIRIEGLTIEDA